MYMTIMVAMAWWPDGKFAYIYILILDRENTGSAPESHLSSEA